MPFEGRVPQAIYNKVGTGEVIQLILEFGRVLSQQWRLRRN
jgi:hypothetical protein